MPTPVENSTFLDLTSYGTTTAATVAEAFHLAGTSPAHDNINVAFILPRANDPAALLSGNWASRQTTLQQLNDSNSLWSTYGAKADDFNAARTLLSGYGAIIGDATGSGGYVTSQESRTIWVSLTPEKFESLFSTKPYQSGDLYYWNGNLSLPDNLGIAGLWFDTAPWFGTPPAVSDLSGGAVAPLIDGPQSVGNSLAANDAQSKYFPGDIAHQFYNFPLAQGVKTETIGLIEPGIGDALPADPGYTFLQALEAYRRAAGIDTPGSYYAIGSPGNYSEGNSGERSLDVGVLASASPGSRIGLYSGSALGGDSHANAFTAYQAAFWDKVNSPSVVSSSFSIFQQTKPGSIFAAAVQDLFIDAALRNITMVQANNDFGSSWAIATGLANQAINSSSPYMLLVGGTSLTNLEKAPLDPTVADTLYGPAMAGDLSTLWRLVQGGLTVLPSAAPAGFHGPFLEAVWNSFALADGIRTPTLGASDGGVDTTQSTPSYQSAFGLTPTSVNPGHATGRGAPDVSANSGGNMFYLTPLRDMTLMSQDEGTSAATPLWAALIAQVDTIFKDQGLPNLGFAHDLIYTAAAVAPGSFNDITFGNNVTSYIEGGSAPIQALGADGNYHAITLTGFGYYAGPGYDLTTGLGSPNGTLLARALTAIAHSQMSFGANPDMLEDAGSGWTSGADQSLMFQAITGTSAKIGLGIGSHEIDFSSAASASYAWTSQLAQQSLQPGFDPNLVRLFDRQAQGWVGQSDVATGEALAVSINSTSASAFQGSMSMPFGFADFMSSDGVVRVARPVAVAETAGGQDDQIAIVRLRQNGEDNLSLIFYRVDDLKGDIDGIHVGEAGYAAAVAGRAYQTTTGGPSVGGPGYGNYAQTGLLDVDGGDLIAMELVNNTSGAHFWAFAHANEIVAGQPVGHLWSYGLNTWGWEDQQGGGDRDFNDLIVQIDFTSAAGHAWLV